MCMRAYMYLREEWKEILVYIMPGGVSHPTNCFRCLRGKKSHELTEQSHIDYNLKVQKSDSGVKDSFCRLYSLQHSLVDTFIHSFIYICICTYIYTYTYIHTTFSNLLVQFSTLLWLIRGMLQKRGPGGDNEQLMFHGTSLAGIVGIATNGAVLRSKNAEQFGVGFYGSPTGQGNRVGMMMALDSRVCMYTCMCIWTHTNTRARTHR